MKIRNATSKDKKEVSKLFYSLYRETSEPNRIYTVDLEEKKKKIIPFKIIAKNIIVVAEEKKKIIGFCWTVFYSHGNSSFAYIEEIFVDKKYRNKGIGEKLIKETIRKLKKMKIAVVFTTTSKKNKFAQRFYRDVGFKRDDSPWFYWTPKKK